ncbi:MAG: alpha-rhamnosidase [Clostridia bacterium]|nr:alpha-rhamnosidase [Clostridia bacterium]
MAKWIWNRGDFEIYHASLLNNRREDKGHYSAPMWRTDGIRPNALLYKIAELDVPEKLRVHANCACSVRVNDAVYDADTDIELKKGRNFVKIFVYNQTGLPAAYAEGETFASDESWMSAGYGADDLNVGCNDMYLDRDDDPSVFVFRYETLTPVSAEKLNGGTLFDFGRETFGLLHVKNEKMSCGTVDVIYGESREEATDAAHAIITDKFDTSRDGASYRARALRYVFVGSESVTVTLDYEYLPLEHKGRFICNDATVNKIYDVCAYTLHLNSREFFLDGIKRDRWVWGGDAYQSYFCNYYLFNDFDIVRRTTLALRGGDPMTQFTNTIPDYTLFWIIGLYEYYFNSGDIDFLRFACTKLDGIIRLIDSRLDDRGLFIGKRGDWVFIDWADTAKTGCVCAEQVLLYAAYDATAKIYEACGYDGARAFRARADAVADTVNSLFWNERLGAYVDCIGREDRQNVVTRHANIFAILYGVADERKSAIIRKKVINNADIAPITTPYFEFFELDSMAKLGEFGYIRDMLMNYWGGMLRQGATTFWEQFDPSRKGSEHYEMYGRPYGMSLCHAWSASPIYLIGRYVMGVHPTSVGYGTFEVSPNTLGFTDFDGAVPTAQGDVEVSLHDGRFTVTAHRDGGTLIVGGKRIPLGRDESVSCPV